MIAGGRVRFTASGRALRHRNFQLFFAGQLISVTGTWMQSTAQAWLLATLVGADQALFYLGLLGAVQFLPVLVLGLFGGIIADLWPKRRTVIGTQTAAGLLALVLAVLVYSGHIQIWHIFVLGFLLGIVNAVDMPARQSFVVEMVGRDDVANAIGLNSAVFNGARIIGPAVGGILIGVVGTALCFFLNAVSYVAVVAGLLAMREEELMPANRLVMPRSVGAIRENLAEGLSYVRQTPIVLLAIAIIGLVSTFGMNFNATLPAIARDVLHSGPEGFGFLTASMGLGALIAALSVASLRRPHVRVLIGGGIIMAAAELVLAGTTVFPVAMVAVFVAGAGAIGMAATANSLVQITVPGALRGRVMSVYTTVFAGSTPIGNGLTGLVGAGWGTPPAVFMNGFMSLVVLVFASIAVLQGRVADVGRGRRGDRPPDQAAVRKRLQAPLGK